MINMYCAMSIVLPFTFLQIGKKHFGMTGMQILQLVEPKLELLLQSGDRAAGCSGCINNHILKKATYQKHHDGFTGYTKQQ